MLERCTLRSPSSESASLKRLSARDTPSTAIRASGLTRFLEGRWKAAILAVRDRDLCEEGDHVAGRDRNATAPRAGRARRALRDRRTLGTPPPRPAADDRRA